MSFKAAIFSLVFLASRANANMMPYHEGTQAIGHLIAEHPQLQIRKENLQIQLYDRHALVDVVYEVKNTGAAITVPAVFPSTAIAEVKDFQVRWGHQRLLVVNFKTSSNLEKIQTGATITLALYPGSGQSRDLYFANNRIAALDVAINGKTPFTMQLPDEVKPWHMIELPTQETINKIELRVTAVHPGSRFDNTMISALSLRAYVKEIP